MKSWDLQKIRTEYAINQFDIDSLTRQIREKKALLKRKVDSQFHAQWDQAERLIDEINALEASLKQRLKNTEKAGYSSAYKQVNSSALFLALSETFTVSVGKISIIVYGILSLLIECCSLGAISLAKNFKRQALNQTRKARSPELPKAENNSLIISNKMDKLRQDIISGKMAPIIRRIRQSGYKLSEKNIRHVLSDLTEQGVLVKGPKSLQLSKSKL